MEFSLFINQSTWNFLKSNTQKAEISVNQGLEPMHEI